MYYKYTDEKKSLGHIETIEFPDRDAVHFDKQAGVIDLDPLNDYFNHPMCMHYEDGKTRTAILKETYMTEAMQADGTMKVVKGFDLAWDDENGK